MSKRASRPEAWFEKAEHDLEMIRRALVADGAPPWDMVAFHAQQAGEKYLKGFLVARGIDPPKIHDLRPLLSLCREHDGTLASLDEDCQALSQLGWMSRYPDSPAEPTEADSREAVLIAQRITAAIRERVPKSSAP